MEPWKTIKSEYLFRDEWLTVHADSCERADDLRINPYYVLEYSDWVHVIAFDSGNHVLVTRQYRHAIGKICTEIISGGIEQNEDPIEAAQRELREETGCTAETFTSLPNLYPNPATHTNTIYCFIATGVKLTHSPDPDESEEIMSEFLPVNKVLDLIDSGEFSQGLHIASLMLALRRLGLLNESRE